MNWNSYFTNWIGLIFLERVRNSKNEWDKQEDNIVILSFYIDKVKLIYPDLKSRTINLISISF